MSLWKARGRYGAKKQTYEAVVRCCRSNALCTEAISEHMVIRLMSWLVT